MGLLNARRLSAVIRQMVRGSLIAFEQRSAGDAAVGGRSKTMKVEGSLIFLGYGGTISMPKRRRSWWRRLRRSFGA